MAKQRCPLNFNIIAGTNILCELQHAIIDKKNHISIVTSHFCQENFLNCNKLKCLEILQAIIYKNCLGLQHPSGSKNKKKVAKNMSVVSTMSHWPKISMNFKKISYNLQDYK